MQSGHINSAKRLGKLFRRLESSVRCRANMATSGEDRRRDQVALGLKRGDNEEQAKLHKYLVSKSYRAHPALDKLQEGFISGTSDEGYTALGVALALPADGKLHALDLSEEYASIGRPYWKEAGVEDKIQLHIGAATESLKKLEKELGVESVDFAFIDADKSNYDKYYESILNLLRPGGVVAFDNVLWQGSVVDDSDHTPDTKAIKALNSKLHADERVTIAMLKNSDGITVAVKN